jgi:hypothetical protein
MNGGNRLHTILTVSALGVIAATLTPATRAAAVQPVIVTPSVEVDHDLTPGRAHSEPQLNVDPKNPNILAVAEAEFQSSSCYVYVSRDGGRTWEKTPSNPVPAQYKSCARPSFGPFIASRFGIDGTLYVAATGANTATNSGPTDPYVARSTDLGAHWQFTIIHQAVQRSFPKPDGTTATDFERFNYVRLAVSPTDPKKVYAGFREQGATLPVSQVSERSVVSVSTDGGQTFGPLNDIMSETFPLTQVKGSDAPAMAVASDGTIYAFTKERPPLAAGGPTEPELPLPPGPANTCQPASANPTTQAWIPTPPTSTPPVAGQPGAGARLLMSKSTDNGKTWHASVVDTSGIVCVPCLTTPEAAVDPHTGAVYVVFEESVTGPPNPRDDRNIYFLRSTDGGKTWGPRQELNDDASPQHQPGYDQMFPGISIAPDGRIDVAWWDFRTDGLYNPSGNGNTTRRDETCFDIYYTSSSDGGKTWAKNTRVSDLTMNQNEGFAENLNYDLRGPVGITSTNNAAYVAWSDSRSGRVDLPQEDVYTSTVVYNPPASKTSSSVKASSIFLGGVIGAILCGGVLVLLFLGLARRRAAHTT